MKRTNPGFTLVELLMVVLIISLLIFILIPAVTGVVKQVDIHQTQMMVNLLDLGCQQYHAAFGSYPPNWISAQTPPSTNNLDGWNWGVDYKAGVDGDPCDGNEAIFLLTYCLQGPAGIGWKMNRDGKLKNNSSASVTADFGPWIEAGNQSIQPRISNPQTGAHYRPVFVDSFGTPICYFGAMMHYNTTPTRPNLACPFDPNWPATEFQTDRYSVDEATQFFSSGPLTYPSASKEGFVVNSLGITSYSQMTGCPSFFGINHRRYIVFYAAVMNRTFNPSTGWSGASMTGKCYNSNTCLIWSAGPDRLFGFWYYDDTWNGYVLDLTFNPANFDDITNFR